MKIAISGKGGVGKSTVAGSLALLLAKNGQKVLALDADPDANLASALGIPHSKINELVTISKQLSLIEERTGVQINEYGKVFKLNPEVSDVAEKFGLEYNGVNLVVLGAITRGGGGCACPESTFIQALVNDLVLYKNEALIMDMEAGIEHLGRATSNGVDLMLVVVEPGRRSVDCANTVTRMAKEIGVKKIAYVGNKISDTADEEYLYRAMPETLFLGMIPYSEQIRAADKEGKAPFECDAVLAEKIGEILSKIEGSL